jgi:crossover junction endodeoxyribonuclease RusA
MDEITITLPLPPKELSPNARVHWAKKAGTTKKARALAWGEARALGWPNRKLLPWLRAQTQAVFYFPTERDRDQDNAAASLKPYWDGIADAGVVLSDAGLVHLPPRLLVDRERPRVELTLRPLP